MLKSNQKIIGLLLVIFSCSLIIILVFVKADIDNLSSFLCEAVHSNPNLDMSKCPVHTSNISWMIVLAFGIVFLILGGGIYMIFMPGGTERQAFKDIDISKLDGDERKTYELLRKNEGSLYQSDFIKETGFSKVQTTRILDKMESKNIIERRRRGMTNIIVVK